jgi:iron complex transport system substrate-binding protein
MRPGRLRTAALLLSFMPAVCGAQKKPDMVLDDLGNPFPVSVSPRKIISLAPNITEILFSLGLGETIAGVTRFCDYPAEALSKEKIGGLVDPNLEKIQALHPGLVIAFRGNPLRTLARLKELGIPVFILQEGTRVEEVFQTIEKIGLVTGVPGRAAELISSLKAGFGRTREALRNAAPSPRVFVSLHGSGLWTCGRESFLNDLLEKAGAVNIVGDLSRNWLLMGREPFIQQDPEAIVILAKSEADFEKGREWFLDESSFKKVAAVRNGRIYHLDENAASRFGPRLLETLDKLAHLLHPEVMMEQP